jgi:hypothetical protein
MVYHNLGRTPNWDVCFVQARLTEENLRLHSSAHRKVCGEHQDSYRSRLTTYADRQCLPIGRPTVLGQHCRAVLPIRWRLYRVGWWRRERTEEQHRAEKGSLSRSVEGIRWSLCLWIPGSSRSPPDKTEIETSLIPERRGLGDGEIDFLHEHRHGVTQLVQRPQQPQQPATGLRYLELCR